MFFLFCSDGPFVAAFQLFQAECISAVEYMLDNAGSFYTLGRVEPSVCRFVIFTAAL